MEHECGLLQYGTCHILGLTVKLPKRECVRRLERSKADQVEGLRQALFESAVRKGLGEEDELMREKVDWAWVIYTVWRM